MRTKPRPGHLRDDMTKLKQPNLNVGACEAGELFVISKIKEKTTSKGAMND
jgi:hypothetical protein